MKETADPHGAQLRARAVIDLAAVRANVRTLRERAPGAALMAVVKADGYGHGAAECARAAVQAGCHLAGHRHAPGGARAEGARVGCAGRRPGHVLAVDARRALAGGDRGRRRRLRERLLGAGRGRRGGEGGRSRPARVQLKADTGLGRGGCQPGDWPELVAGALRAEAEGLLKVTGLWSHFACADEPGHPSIAAQLLTFREMVAYAEAQGVEPEVRHIANSPATLTLPESHFDLVRPGIALYGVSPSPEIGTSTELGLRPAMTLAASLALVKNVPGGHGVSYGHHYVTAGATTLGLVPLGYADGIPRHASGGGPVLVEGKWRTVAGRVAMDQFVVDLGVTSPGPVPRPCCSGPGTVVSPPRRTGRRRPGPSRTRS